MTDDPFATPTDGDDPDSIFEGATVLAVSWNPALGQTCNCEGWFIVHPWAATTGDLVTVYRGDTYTSPAVGTTSAVKLRRNSYPVKVVYVGAGESEPRFDVILADRLPVEPGDILTFQSAMRG